MLVAWRTCKIPILTAFNNLDISLSKKSTSIHHTDIFLDTIYFFQSQQTNQVIEAWGWVNFQSKQGYILFVGICYSKKVCKSLGRQIFTKSCLGLLKLPKAFASFLIIASHNLFFQACPPPCTTLHTETRVYNKSKLEFRGLALN